jgi:hypothetical protein
MIPIDLLLFSLPMPQQLVVGLILPHALIVHMESTISRLARRQDLGIEHCHLSKIMAISLESMTKDSQCVDQ